MANTPNLGLHQWAAGDSFLRTDFNEDFGKLDTAVQNAFPLVGKFTGNGTVNRRISLGFRPSVVVLLCYWLGANAAVCVLTETRVTILWDSQNRTVQHQTPMASGGSNIILTEDGFQMGLADHFNKQGMEQVYFAFH